MSDPTEIEDMDDWTDYVELSLSVLRKKVSTNATLAMVGIGAGALAMFMAQRSMRFAFTCIQGITALHQTLDSLRNDRENTIPTPRTNVDNDGGEGAPHTKESVVTTETTATVNEPAYGPASEPTPEQIERMAHKTVIPLDEPL